MTIKRLWKEFKEYVREEGLLVTMMEIPGFIAFIIISTPIWLLMLLNELSKELFKEKNERWK